MSLVLMNKHIDYFFPIKVWIITVLFTSILFFLDFIYLAAPPPRKLIPEDIIIFIMIFWGLLTYSLPILLLLGAILFFAKNDIKNFLLLKAILIFVGVGLTLAVFLYFGFEFNWVVASCLSIEVAAGIIFKGTSKNPSHIYVM